MQSRDLVASQDVPVMILQKKISSAKSPEDKERFEKDLQELMQARELVRYSVNQIVEKCTDSPEHAQQVLDANSSAYVSQTYKEIVEHFKANCLNWHNPKYETARTHLYIFANLLEEKVSVERIKTAIDEVGASLKNENVETVVSPN